MEQTQLARQLQNQGADIGLSRRGMILRIDTRTCSDIVTDDWIARLNDCNRLKEIYLAKSQVTDAGVESLARLERLHTIDLQHTAVTDNSLRTLAALPKLKVLLVRGTQVSQECVAQMRRQMTGTRIIFE